MAFVLIQHLDPIHESALVQLLSRASSLPVQEITNHLPVRPDRVYVIPRDTHLTIADGVLNLRPRERTRTPHRPIDAFFESLAADRREQAIGVVLSGTANDGTLGLESIKAEGGITFAQDDSAAHDSMPRSAIAAGCVDLVLSPADIAAELARIAKHPYVAGQALAPRPGIDGAATVDGDRLAEDTRASATTHAEDASPLPSRGHGTPRTGAKQAREEAEEERGQGGVAGGATTDADGYRRVLLLLRRHSGVDFSLYKSSTIQRRIHRRLIVSKQETLEGYADFLRGNAKELDALYSDVLISVTSFFRNPEAFDVLQRKVFPRLFEQPGDGPVRCWVLGCSTGQEAYSLAMALVEAMDQGPRMRGLQVFATDLNEALLEKARHGSYAKSLADDISPERLRRFFVEEEGGYRVSKMLRDMVVFARQNLISDPPFSRMDLISCRNLLIYLEPSLQKKAIPTFHYALKPGGVLFLGASESIGGFTDLFDPKDKKQKIYAKKAGPTSAFHLPVRRAHDDPAAGRRRGPEGEVRPGTRAMSSAPSAKPTASP
jgi:two-component system CheB/CheR fusion protein